SGESLIQRDRDRLRALRGLHRLRVLMGVEESLGNRQRVLGGFDVGLRQAQYRDESLRQSDRFLRVPCARRLQEANPRSLVVEHVIPPFGERRQSLPLSRKPSRKPMGNGIY